MLVSARADLQRPHLDMGPGSGQDVHVVSVAGDHDAAPEGDDGGHDQGVHHVAGVQAVGSEQLTREAGNPPAGGDHPPSSVDGPVHVGVLPASPVGLSQDGRRDSDQGATPAGHRECCVQAAGRLATRPSGQGQDSPRVQDDDPGHSAGSVPACALGCLHLVHEGLELGHHRGVGKPELGVQLLDQLTQVLVLELVGYCRGNPPADPPLADRALTCSTRSTGMVIVTRSLATGPSIPRYARSGALAVHKPIRQRTGLRHFVFGEGKRRVLPVEATASKRSRSPSACETLMTVARLGLPSADSTL